MPDAPLVIDVRATHDEPPDMFDGPVVVVEPVYGCVAVAAALDAGWESVELCAERPGEAPIPLVSFEQPPGNSGRRCRVRADDLVDVVGSLDLDGRDATLVAGAPVNARPLGSMLARVEGAMRVTFLVAASGQDDSASHSLTADAMWSAGMLIRILLEELDDRPSALTDAAGIAVTLAQGAEDPAAQLSAGIRWRRHVERGGHPDDLRIASAIDSVGVVPRIDFEGESIIAVPWIPASV
jgi:hypothetical protein